MRHPTRPRRSVAPTLGLTASLAVIVAMVPGVASAQTAPPDARGTDEVCEELEAYDRDAFTDTRGSAHERNVLCMADHGLTEGLRGGERYGPRLDVTRGQMASFVARFIEDYTGEALPEGDDDRFTDVPASSDEYAHADNIQALAEIEVVEGTAASDGTAYAPQADVTRGQMASFIRRALSYLHNGRTNPVSAPPPAVEDHFSDDDGSTHEENINAIAAEGIVQGFEDGDYRPNARVKRDQMASFVMRAYDYAVANDLGLPDTDAPAFVSSDPEDGDSDVPFDVSPSVTFDEDIDDATVALACDDTDVPGDTDITDETVTFDPTDDLDNDAECTLTVTASDAAGNESDEVTVTFTTEEEGLLPV